jgi:hypothetical protein
MTTIADILASPTLNELRADLLARLNVPSYPVTDQMVGGVMRTLFEIEARVVLDLIGADGTAEAMANGAASGTSTADWQTALAHAMYELDRVQGTFAEQTITLSRTADGGNAYTITAGRGTATNPAGQRFSVASGGTLTSGGSLAIQVLAESPGANLGLVTRLISPSLPGVTVTSAVIFDPGSGPMLGSNRESDTALQRRIDARWNDLTAVPGRDRMVKWATASGTEITRVRLDVDGANPGGVLITVAGVSGPVSGGAVTAAQAYIDARAPITDYPTVQNATAVNVTATSGTVRVAAAQLATAQGAADAAWATVLSQTVIGGVVYVSKLEQVIMDQAGVIDALGLEINALGTDLHLTATQVPVKTGNLNTLTWEAV